MLNQQKSQCGNFEFISFLKTPSEKSQLGIISVRVYGRILLRFKVIATKDGKGSFITSPSYPIGENESKKYLQAIVIDSRVEEESLQDFMRSFIKQTNCFNKIKNEDVDVGECLF